jgi:uncharacterized protein (DUF2062 family)
MNKITAWLQRRVVDPLVQELKKGITPEALAMATAVGLFLCVSPIIGTTTVLCLFFGWLLKLNQVVLMTINFFSYPLQIAMIVPFVRLGEVICRADPLPLNPQVMVQSFANSPSQFLHDFGMAGVHGILGWLVAAPFIIGILLFIFRPLYRQIAQRWKP